MPAYACLSYNSSMNLGDEIQSIAAIEQFRAHNKSVTENIDRDTRSISSDETLVCSYNGWFDGDYCLWPPSGNVKPLFISFHINEVPKEPCYASIEKYKTVMTSLIDPKFKEYYMEHSPIYTRDRHTEGKLCSIGVNAKFLGCLTMTLPSPQISLDKREGVYIVDVEAESYGKIPEAIRTSALRVTHVSQSVDRQEKMVQAHHLLSLYQRAKLVVTSRLHCILPCLAFNTPVILLFNAWDTDPRFDGLSELMSIVGRDHIDWGNHINKDPTRFLEMREELMRVMGAMIGSSA